MSWKNPLHEHATNQQKFTIDGAVEYFRAEELEPLRVGNECPHCHKGELTINPVDVEERMQLRIGAYRIAMCSECFAYCVVFPLRNVPKHQETEVKSKTTQAEYDALMASWQENNKGGPEAAMQELHRKWANSEVA